MVEEKEEIVVNENGTAFYFAEAVKFMDKELVRELEREVESESGQVFFDAYIKLHHERIGEDWILEAENPDIDAFTALCYRAGVYPWSLGARDE